MQPVAISELTLWLLQLATILVVVGLARQVGLLYLRLPPQGSGSRDKPTIGSTVEVPAVTSLKSRPHNVLVEGRIALVLFANPGCSLCAPVLEAARRLKRVDPEIVVTVAVDGDAAGALNYLNEHGFSDGVPSAALSEIDPEERPLAVALAPDGTVLAAGVPNTLEQLEVLLGDARHTRRSMDGSAPDGELLSISDNRMHE